MQKEPTNFIKSITLTEKDKKALRKLNASDEFQEFKLLVERLLQAKSFTALESPLDKEERYEEIDETRGGFALWIQIKELLELAKK